MPTSHARVAVAAMAAEIVAATVVVTKAVAALMVATVAVTVLMVATAEIAVVTVAAAVLTAVAVPAASLAVDTAAAAVAANATKHNISIPFPKGAGTTGTFLIYIAVVPTTDRTYFTTCEICRPGAGR